MNANHTHYLFYSFTVTPVFKLQCGISLLEGSKDEKFIIQEQRYKVCIYTVYI